MNFPEQNKDFAIQNMGERGISFCEQCSQYFFLVCCCGLDELRLEVDLHSQYNVLHLCHIDDYDSELSVTGYKINT